MKTKFNLVGNTFTHLTNGNKGYSVHGKESKYIEWVKDGSGEATFYIDSTLGQAEFDEVSGPKYGWLLESKYITPQIVDSVKMFPEKYLETFDIIFTHNQELLKIDSKFKWVPAQGFWIKEPKIYEKSKIISMIASNKQMCEGHRLALNGLKDFGVKLICMVVVSMKSPIKKMVFVITCSLLQLKMDNMKHISQKNFLTVLLLVQYQFILEHLILENTSIKMELLT